MDKASTLLGLGLVIMTALPFIIYNLYKKLKKRNFMKDFIEMSKKEKLTFSVKELWGNRYAIGIDTESHKLFYFNKQADNIPGTLIDLSGVEKCRIVTIDRHLKSQNGNGNQTNRIELVFTHNNPGAPETVLEFYKNAEFMPTTDDFGHVEKWMNIITSRLSIKQ